jgi:sugar phosphate isomerase/epimerase
MTDRRRFLRLVPAAVAGLAALPNPNLPRAAAEEGGDPFGGFTLGVQSFTFRNFDLEPALRRIRDLGLHSAELYQKHAPLTTEPAPVNAVLRLCNQYGVTPRAWGVQHFGKDRDANRRTFEFGRLLGLQALSANPEPDAFDGLDKLCEEYKIAVAIHPHGPVGGGKLDRWYSAEAIYAAVKDHHPLIGACLDTGHLIRAAQLGKSLDPAEQVRVMRDRNFGLHLKDHDNQRRTDVPLGTGVLDVAAVLRALRDVKFKGMISIEYEANPEEPTRDVAACVAAFKGAVKKVS